MEGRDGLMCEVLDDVLVHGRLTQSFVLTQLYDISGGDVERPIHLCFLALYKYHFTQMKSAQLRRCVVADGDVKVGVQDICFRGLYLFLLWLHAVIFATRRSLPCWRVSCELWSKKLAVA